MNIIHIAVPDPDALLDPALFGPGAFIRLERSATFGGVYAEIGTIGLVTLTTFYTYYDSAGTPGLWYKSRYSDAGATVFSAYSTPWQGGIQAGLCLLQDARARINTDDPTDTTNDAALLGYITAATDLIHNITGRYYLPDPASGADGTFYFDGNGDSVLWIPRGIQGITTLSLALQTGGAYADLGAGDFFLKPEVWERAYADQPAWRVVLSDMGANLFWPGQRTVKVLGKLGHASVPPTIERIALETVTRAWNRRPSGDTYLGGSEGLASQVKWSMAYEDRKLLEERYRDIY